MRQEMREGIGETGDVRLEIRDERLGVDER